MPQKDTHSMNNHLSRRTLTKSAAWAAPVVLASSAVPAYAASQNPQYYGAQSRSIDPQYPDRSCYIYTDVWTTRAVGQEPAGFSLGYEPGEAVDTTATLTSLEFWVAIPQNMADSVTIYSPTSQYWTQTSRTTITEIEHYTNGTFSTDSVSSYYLYKFTFSGPKTNQVRYSGDTTTWPNSTIDLRFHGNSCAYDTTVPTIYSGYVANYTTENGAAGEVYLVGKQSQRP